MLSPHTFEATIIYICFGAEEQGLVGSKHYVENVVIPQALDLRGMVNVDMIAFVHPDHPGWDANVYADEVQSLELGGHFTRTLNDYTTCTDYLVPTELPQWGSDHFWFANHGYPATYGIDAQGTNAPDWNPHWHRTTDRIGTLDLHYLAEFTRGAIACIAEIAVLDELNPVELASFEVSVEDGAVTIAWQTALEENVLGFNVQRADAGDGAGSPPRFAALHERPVPATGRAGSRYEFVDSTAVPGETYSYRLESIDRSGEVQVFDAREITVGRALPSRLTLRPARPNPFNPATSIEYELPAEEQVSLVIYDTAGRLVRTLVDGHRRGDVHREAWDGRDAAGRMVGTGIYVVRLRAGQQVRTTKLVLMK